MRKTSLYACALIMGIGTNAGADPWIPTYYRCTFDQLDPSRAIGRFQWANRHSLANMYRVPDSRGNVARRDKGFLSEKYALEGQNTNEEGKTAVYPVYVDPTTLVDGEAKPWIGPGGPGTASASLLGPELVNLDYTIKPRDILNDGLCEAGCYTPDQKVLFETEELPISVAQRLGRADLLTLSPDSTLGKIELIKNPVLHYTMDQKPAQQRILTFHTESGGKLSVTTEHPLVTRDGAIKRAKLFTLGEHLVRQDGSFDEIVDIEDAMWMGRVYNLKPVSTNLTANILVAQGFLNGSGRYQSEYVNELNRIILRDNVPDELIPGK